MDPRGRILIVEDESSIRSELAELLREEHYTVETAADGYKALPKLEEFNPELVLTDLRMPGMDGFELMKHAQKSDSQRAVVLLTAHAAVETAVRAMKEGAEDYLTKPINLEELLVVIERALDRRRLRAEMGRLRQQLAERNRIENLVGSSKEMRQVYEKILQVAPSRASVLVTGESGTGKELVAAAIHQHSPRRDQPFIKLHCAALSEGLLESELFGHERGAFTGALNRRDGRFQQADGGTLFLDEIGEIGPTVQVKLLRFLQEREYERVGGNQTIKVDVRIVAATHRDLKSRIKAGLFREDLYYRLNVFAVEMPALRERKEDIPLLAMHFLRRFAQENGKPVTAFSAEALRHLLAGRWKGNVRELENAVERAVVVCNGPEIRVDDLELADDQPSGEHLPRIPGASLWQLERYAITKTLEHTGGSTSKAAEILGISPRKIQYKLHEYQSSGSGAHHEAPPPANDPGEEDSRPSD